MVKYIVKRLLMCLLILFGVSIIIYFLVLLMPADYVDQKFASQIAQGAMDKAAIQEMKEKYALADKSFGGILNGYVRWLGGVCTGDLGRSFKYDMPVTTVIVENMGISFGISFVALILQFVIAIPLGIKAACNQYGKIDYTVTVLTMMGISLPTFFLAALLVQVFSINLGWFPVNGLVTANLPVDTSSFERFLDELWHLVLPMTTLVILSIGGLMRHTRTNMLEVLNADYIRTARAKGLSERTVVYKHAFKNTMIPIVTMTAGIIPSLFGGAMITETVFGIPGIGKMAYDALKIGDVPFVMGYNMFLAILTVIGTLLSDLMYMLVDPRVKLTK
ncbi:MAG: ABC transporter permease [Clostridia bacterium]|nr:ABC transporter permease [Clostridia bacterium]